MLPEYANSLLEHLEPLVRDLGATERHEGQGTPTTVIWATTVSDDAIVRATSFQHGLVILSLREAVREGSPSRNGHGVTTTDRYQFSAHCAWRHGESEDSTGAVVSDFARNERVRSAIESHSYKSVRAQHEQTKSLAALSDCCISVYEIQFSIPLNHHLDIVPEDAAPLKQAVVQQGDDRDRVPHN